MLAVNTSSLSSQLAEVIDRCVACASACAACTAACGASGLSDTFRTCELVSADCADICRATAQVASRYSGGETRALAALLRACTLACADCAAECQKHALPAAQRCVLASLECKQACERLAQALRWR